MFKVIFQRFFSLFVFFFGLFFTGSAFAEDSTKDSIEIDWSALDDLPSVSKIQLKYPHSNRMTNSDSLIKNSQIDTLKSKDYQNIVSETGQAFALDFALSVTSLSEHNIEQLSAVTYMVKDIPNAQIKIISYAKDNANGSRRAKRISLLRAEAVRNQLLKNNISPAIINVKALGNQVKKDIVYLEVLDKQD